MSIRNTKGYTDYINQAILVYPLKESVENQQKTVNFAPNYTTLLAKYEIEQYKLTELYYLLVKSIIESNLYNISIDANSYIFHGNSTTPIHANQIIRSAYPKIHYGDFLSLVSPLEDIPDDEAIPILQRLSLNRNLLGNLYSNKEILNGYLEWYDSTRPSVSKLDHDKKTKMMFGNFTWINNRRIASDKEFSGCYPCRSMNVYQTNEPGILIDFSSIGKETSSYSPKSIQQFILYKMNNTSIAGLHLDNNELKIVDDYITKKNQAEENLKNYDAKTDLPDVLEDRYIALDSLVNTNSPTYLSTIGVPAGFVPSQAINKYLLCMKLISGYSGMGIHYKIWKVFDKPLIYRNNIIGFVMVDMNEQIYTQQESFADNNVPQVLYANVKYNNLHTQISPECIFFNPHKKLRFNLSFYNAKSDYLYQISRDTIVFDEAKINDSPMIELKSLTTSILDYFKITSTQNRTNFSQKLLNVKAYISQGRILPRHDVTVPLVIYNNT